MPFIRQARDKRGFEQTLVMHAYHGAAAGPQRPRVLYLFRTPANLRVGRTALDGEVREALEHTHPDLSFDWGAIVREAPPPRVEAHRERPRRPAPRPEAPAARQTPASAPPPPADDSSMLGRAVGPSEAARLRQRFAELVQRVGRRAPTPEERDRLLDQLRRLNPDEWADEATARANAPSVGAAWDEVGRALPSRRRGRRGGRPRPDAGRPLSGIMATSAPENDERVHDTSEDARPVDDGRAEPGGGDAPDRPDTRAAAGPDDGLPPGD
jgi:hypothetical protein